MTLVTFYKDLGGTRDIQIRNVDNEVITPKASDEIRVKIGHEGRSSKLTVTGTPSAAGSVFTKNSPSSGFNRLRLDASDLNFPAGIYTLFVELKDASDANEWKNVDRFVFSLQESSPS